MAHNPNGSSRTEQPWLNDTFSDYKNIAKLGQGAYGTVWHATHIHTGREVARKRVRVKLSDEGVPQSVIREIAALKHVEHCAHKNIVKLEGISHRLNDEQNEIHIDIIFEKCDWDLYTYLNNIPGCLNDAQARYVAIQFFEGLDFLHNRSLVHRDLKPQNILINKNGDIKIADFGLARLYNSASVLTTVAVTLWYRSPELLLHCSYGPSVDMWSAGCIVAEIYTKKPLFPGRNELEELRKILSFIGLPSQTEWPVEASLMRENFEKDERGILIPLAGEGRLHKQLVRFLPKYISPDALDFFEQILTFDPEKRLSVIHALDHPFLAQARRH